MTPTGLKRAPVFVLLLGCFMAANAETPRKDLTIRQRMMVLEGDGSRLKVNELYTVQSNSGSSPAKTGQLTLEIYLPDGAAITQATARSAGVQSVKTILVPLREKNRYAFTYAVRAGQTQYTVTYTLPYNGQLRIDPRITYPTTQLMLVAPDTMRLVPEDTSALVPANDPQLHNVSVHVASDVTLQRNLAFEVQGSGSLTRLQEQGQPSAAAQRGPTAAGGSQEGVAAQQQASAGKPPSQWIFLAVLFLFLAAGATYIYSVHHTVPAATASPSAPSLLAEMKDEMFQLEADRLQGKLSPEEYDAAKTALDRAMRKIL